MSEIPYGYCQCGCGQKTRLAPQTVRNKGLVKGEPLRYVRNHQPKGPKIKPIAERFWAKVNIPDDHEKCWEWQGSKDGNGYGSLIIRKKMIQVRLTTHRISWEIAYGEIPEGLCVCHKCDNRKCVNPNHLFLGTNLDNIRDKIQKGRQPVGEKVPNHKLTSEQVRLIRQEYASGQKGQRKLAKEFGVDKTTIKNIVHRTTWKEVV